LVTAHEVLLTVPALPEFLRVARVTASGLASRLGFSLDEVDDLRLALDELCFALIGRADAGAGLQLRYVLHHAGLTIEGSAATAPVGPVVLGDLSRQILTALVDDHRLWEDADGSHFSLTKTQASVTL
jgi:serine/threonine-protein kinase RsbW